MVAKHIYIRYNWESDHQPGSCCWSLFIIVSEPEWLFWATPAQQLSWSCQQSAGVNFNSGLMFLVETKFHHQVRRHFLLSFSSCLHHSELLWSSLVCWPGDQDVLSLHRLTALSSNPIIYIIQSVQMIPIMLRQSGGGPWGQRALRITQVKSNRWYLVYFRVLFVPVWLKLKLFHSAKYRKRKQTYADQHEEISLITCLPLLIKLAEVLESCCLFSLPCETVTVTINSNSSISQTWQKHRHPVSK